MNTRMALPSLHAGIHPPFPRLHPLKHRIQHRLSSLPSIQPYSESDASDDASTDQKPQARVATQLVDPQALEAAERTIELQQAAGLPPAYDYIATKKIVETAMLAAVAGLSYTLAFLLKLEGYLSYVLPLPIVLAALRGGMSSAFKCLSVTCLLLFILMGPFRAITFFLMYGLLSLAMGASMALRLPWSLGVPLGAFSRMVGILGYFSLSSLMTNENLLAIMLHNLQAMLDQFSAFAGSGGGAPSLTAVAITMASLLLVNATFYVFMMNLLYTLILRGMGYYNIAPIPRFLNGLVGASASGGTTT